MRLVNIGYGNVVVADRVVAVISPDSAPMKRFKDEARKAGRLIDGTQGRRTRSILITDSHHIVLSALQTETVAERLDRGGVGSQATPSQPSAVMSRATGSVASTSDDEGDREEADDAESGDAAEDGDDDSDEEEPGHG